MVEVIERKFQDRRWKRRARTLRGTGATGRRCSQVPPPPPVIWGENDRVLSDVPGSVRAADHVVPLKARQVVIPRAVTRPQIEKSRLVNHLVSRFLRDRLKAIRRPSTPADPGPPGRPSATRRLPGDPPAELHLTRCMNDHTLFLGKFLTQITRGNPLASIAPSSRWLSRTTVHNIAWDRVQTLVELGHGTGPITRVLAERARPGCRVIVVERNPDFARYCTMRFGPLPELRDRRGGRTPSWAHS